MNVKTYSAKALRRHYQPSRTHEARARVLADRPAQGQRCTPSASLLFIILRWPETVLRPRKLRFALVNISAGSAGRGGKASAHQKR